MSSEPLNENSPCFFCPHIIAANEQHVVWNGCQRFFDKEAKIYLTRANSEIRLHANCALMLAQRLIGDAFLTNPDVSDLETVLYLVENRVKYRG